VSYMYLPKPRVHGCALANGDWWVESSARPVLPSPHWLASSHEHRARAGMYMTWMGIQPLQYPEDEDGDGPRNVGFFAIQPFDTAGSLRRFFYVQKCFN
jgi:hypothetical protein